VSGPGLGRRRQRNERDRRPAARCHRGTQARPLREQHRGPPSGVEVAGISVRGLHRPSEGLSGRPQGSPLLLRKNAAYWLPSSANPKSSLRVEAADKAQQRPSTWFARRRRDPTVADRFKAGPEERLSLFCCGCTQTSATPARQPLSELLGRSVRGSSPAEVLPRLTHGIGPACVGARATAERSMGQFAGLRGWPVA